MRKNYWLTLALILGIALLMRFFLITKIPLCLNWDEASFAYNAYSILKTAKDEYGVFLPLQFKSVGDYKCPLFIYLLVPVIKIFGLNEFAVRFLPSLLGGFSTILIFLVLIIFFNNLRLSLIGSFFLAISPWHLQFTRAGADVGVSNFFVLLGILGLLWGIKGGKFGFLFGFFSLVASMYSYYGERIFVPLFLAFFLFFFRKEIFRYKRNFILGGILGLFFFLPLIFPLISGGHQEKIFKTTIFGYKRPKEYLDLIRTEDKSEIIFSLFHNVPLEYSWMIFDRYLAHFSPSFLFLKGPTEDPRQFIFGMGMLYLFDLPLILLGIYSLLKKGGKYKFFILGWLLLGPIPAAITRDPVHARRALNMIFPLVIISALGFDFFLSKLAKLEKGIKILISGGCLMIFIYFLFFYLASYYVFTPLRTYQGPGGWQCGYKELVEYISPLKEKYDRIIIDTSYQGPYIFFLFYEKYSPSFYQPQAKLVQESPDVLGEGVGFDNYQFRPIYWPKDRGLRKTLFAGPPERLPEKDILEKEARILKRIYFPNGEIAFLIVETL